MAMAATTNFVSDRYYAYVPGKGPKTEEVCQASALTFHRYIPSPIHMTGPLPTPFTTSVTPRFGRLCPSCTVHHT
eukprot:1567337-Pyramimonas_sp.AAC.1